MKKRLISLLLVFAMVLTMLPVTALAAPVDRDTSANLANPFTDVKETDWFYDAVQYARINGFFSGTSKTTFDPNGTMTRGMFVTVLCRMAGVDTEAYKGQSAFSDVPERMYYAPYVAWAAKHGITSGTGDGKFSPDALINRQQMATFFVRYFEAFGIDYGTETNTTTVPADLDSASEWAKEPILKLWNRGLLVGDGTNFNPYGNATRAQAATLATRMDEVVETWYKEPDVASDRVKIDPTTGEAVTPGTTETPTTPSGGGSSYGGGGSSSSSGGGSSGGGTTTTTYYEVQFVAGSGQDATDWTLPETKTYAKDTKISLLPTPYKQDGLFMGWYYDAAMTNIVGSNDTVTKNMTLYAKLGEVTAVSAMETPNYMTVTVPAEDVGNYTFGINGYTAGAVEYFTHVSNLNSDVEFTVSDETVTPIKAYEQGQTYSIKLEDDSSAVFVVDGVAQPAAIRVLNIITEKGEVQNLTLDGDIKYISKESVSYAEGSPMAGLFNVALEEGEGGETQINQVSESGTFTYEGGDIAVGDTVAIYEGTRPDLRTGDTANDTVVYVQITGVNNTTYTYITANTEDVLFTPDVLPVTQTVASAALATVNDGTTTYNLTVAQAAMNFSDSKYAAMGLSAETTVDVGDFIAIYEGAWGANNAEAPEYGRITAITEDEQDGTATYNITYVTATQDEVLAAMDIYDTRNEEIELTDEKIEEIEQDMVAQAIESGFVDEAAEYLVALALETDGFQELSDDLDMDLSSYSITFADGTPVDPETMDLMAVKAEITEKKISAKVNAGELDHFDDNGKKLKGLNAELVMTFTVEVGSGDNKLVIELEAVFEQEVLLNINVSGGAIWKWAWIFPYIYDYQMNANIDVGTYTGIGITATAKTSGADDEGFDWKMSTGNSAGDKIISIGSQIKELMDQKEEFMGKFALSADKGDGGDDDDDASVNSGGLAEKYADFMENAEESWIDIVRVEIFATDGYVDMFHILCYGISGDFVVSANLYVTIGMTFEFAVAKRYNFSLTLFHKQSTSETIDLQEAYYQFDFYVMGTIGVRAGVEFEIAIGLFSLKLDSVGICAEVGAYAQMWGYFYYSLVGNHVKNETTGKKEWQTESSYSGAMFIEIGLYLEISFKAQLFSSDKLTYQPTLYENSWPLWSFGKQQDVYDFAYEDDAKMLTMEIESADTFYLSSALFMMNYMDMKDGKIYGSDSEGGDPPGNFDSDKVVDGDDEEHFIIEVSNPKFTYDPALNKVTVDPKGSTDEVCTITITWDSGPLAFTSRAIQRTLTIHWTDPANARYIIFNPMGGSAVPMISQGAGTSVGTLPTSEKVGYTFGGWYTNYHDPKEFVCPNNGTMPESWIDYGGNQKGIEVFAQWTPKTDTKYIVEHYKQQLNGIYKLVETDTLTGTTDGKTNATSKVKDYSANGFKAANTFEEATIAPDGSTVVKLYYDRDEYDVTFKLNDGSGKEITETYFYGERIAVPQLSRDGYTFDGWDQAVPETVPAKGDLTFTAQWTPNTYGISYVLDGGEMGEDAPTTYTHGTGVKKLATPTRTGYEFGGWYTTTSRLDGTRLTEISETKTGYVFLYAKWTANTYYVTFEDKGGDSETNWMNVTYGEPYGELPKTVLAGHTFVGWYTKDGTTDTNGDGVINDADWGDKVEADTIVSTAGDHTLYAKWTTVPYYVNFRGAGTEFGGSGNPAQQVVGYGNLVNKPTDPTRAGYTFGGWYTDQDYTNPWNFEENRVGPQFTNNNVIYLYAKWTANEYTVSFDSNNGTGTMADQKFTYDDTEQALTANTYTKTGYTFNGWNTQADGSGTAYADAQQVKNLTTDANGIVTLYAQWNENGYSITYELDGGNANNPASYTVSQEITLTAPEKTGYTFTGWSGTDLSGENNKTVTIPAGSTGERTYTAHWTANTYTVSFDYGDGSGTLTNTTVTFDGKYGELPTPTSATGKEFAGWYLNGTKITADSQCKTAEDHTLTAQYGDIAYTITFVTGGGSSVDPIIGTYGSAVTAPNAPTREGYTFAGWDKEIPTIMPAEDRTITAQWTANTYTVSFDVNGGTGTLNSQFVTFDAKYGDLPDPTPAIGKEFVGWYLDGTNITADTECTTAGNHTLTAQYDDIEYTITFDTDGGSGVDSITGTYGSAVTAPADPTRTGYTFAGWDTEIPATMPAENMTITALWTANGIIVEFNLNYFDNGDIPANTPSNITVTFGQPYGDLPTPTRDGYEFNGWRIDGTGTVVDKDTIVSRAENHMLTAQWIEVQTVYDNIVIMGESVTAANAADVLHDGGSVSYNYETNTLTLTNATIEYSGADSVIVFDKVNGSLPKLVVEGACVVRNTKTDGTGTVSGISIAASEFVLQDGTATISGTGTLTITVADNPNAEMVVALYNHYSSTNHFIISGPTVYAHAGAASSSGKSYGVLTNSQPYDAGLHSAGPLRLSGTLVASGYTCAVCTNAITKKDDISQPLTVSASTEIDGSSLVTIVANTNNLSTTAYKYISVSTSS